MVRNNKFLCVLRVLRGCICTFQENATAEDAEDAEEDIIQLVKSRRGVLKIQARVGPKFVQ